MPKKIHAFKTRKRRVRVFQQPFKQAGKVQYTNTWYYRKMVGGQEHQFTLGADKDQAAELAETIWLFLQDPRNTLTDAIATFDRRKVEREEQAEQVTIGEVIQLYRRSYRALEIAERTVKDNSGMLYLVLRIGLAVLRKEPIVLRPGKAVDLEPYEKLPVGALTEHIGWNYREYVVRDIDDEILLKKARETANSTLRQAKSVFSKAALRLYKIKGLNLPDLSGFMSTPPYRVPRKYILPPAEKMLRILQASHELESKDPAAYRAFFLIKQWGLRAGEAAAVKREHLERLSDSVCQLRVVVDGEFSPKSGKGRTIRNPIWVLERMKKWPETDDGFFVGPDTEAFERLNEWLRFNGLDRDEFGKPKHELRAWWISWKIVNEGMAEAQLEAGHADPKTTFKHYGDCHFPDSCRPFYQQSKLA